MTTADAPPPRESHPTPRQLGAGPTANGVGASRLHVFSGPSLSREEILAVLPAARVEPPIARGDLARLHAEGASAFLILDGAFLHRLAVAPSEIVDAIAGGARVFGAASIGAIRAAECWPAGMQGIGAVYRLYRLGLLRDDDEVAVATDPGRGFAALSTALVSLRYAALAGLRAGLLDRAQASAVLTAARRTHFADRRWGTIFGQAGIAFDGDLRTLCEQTDVKRRDALYAVTHLARAPALDLAGVRREPVRRPRDLGAGRAPGVVGGGELHLFGHTLAELRRELVSWLLSSGRYRRYFGESPAATADGAELEASVWAKLLAEGELERELMRWYAFRRLGA